MASGLSTPVGVKNGTDGSLAVAINAMLSLSRPHSFLGIDQRGQCAVISTRGNRYGHVVLRGGSKPNYDSVTIALCERELAANVVMSGYRTPFYNAAIGNVPYSRHVWGGAADIYIDDAPRDGEMDDLNADGRIDRADAEWLAAFIDDLSDEGRFGTGIGGIGIYDSNEAHGPFVHVDTRGFRARW
jgi:hypothetical protein